MTTTATTARERMLLAQQASRTIGLLDDARKSDALRAIADAIEQAAPEIVVANAEDLERGRAGGLSEALQDRLRLDTTRVSALAAAVHLVERACGKEPLVQGLPAHAERVLQALPGARAVAVDRHRESFYLELGHLFSFSIWPDVECDAAKSASPPYDEEFWPTSTSSM